MREGKLLPNREVTDALLLSVDIVRQMVVAAQSGSEATSGIENAVAEQLKKVVGGGSHNSSEKTQVKEESTFHEKI
jgi:hypothetical protein